MLFCVPPVSPNLAINKCDLLSYKNAKTWDIAQFIFYEASPNALTEINSPPHALSIYLEPLVGEWIYDKREQFHCLSF